VHREKLAADILASGGMIHTEHQSNEMYKGSSQLRWNV
jgi:hypothetical protein